MIGALLIAGFATTISAAPLPVQPFAMPVLRDVTLPGMSAASSDEARFDGFAPSDPWLSEDKFRHVAGSWTAAVFGYAAARSVVDADAALAIALPVTAAAGIAKEVFDRRAGGPFSLRDLVADAVGASAAWLFLREVR